MMYDKNLPGAIGGPSKLHVWRHTMGCTSSAWTNSGGPSAIADAGGSDTTSPGAEGTDIPTGAIARIGAACCCEAGSPPSGLRQPFRQAPQPPGPGMIA
jgi:hypothetical protein